MLPSKIGKWMHSHGVGGGVTAFDGLYGEAQPERGISFSGFRYMKG